MEDMKRNKLANPDGFAYRPKVVDPIDREVMDSSGTDFRKAGEASYIAAPMGTQQTGMRDWYKK